MNNEEQKIGRTNSPYRENVSAPDLTMNNESKCCDLCDDSDMFGENTNLDAIEAMGAAPNPENLRDVLIPAPEDWEKSFWKTWGNTFVRSVSGRRIVDIFRPIIASREAAARREGVEGQRVVEIQLLEALGLMYQQYCSGEGHQFMTAGEHAYALLEKYGMLNADEAGRGEVKWEVLDAARSEGVNG